MSPVAAVRRDAPVLLTIEPSAAVRASFAVTVAVRDTAVRAGASVEVAVRSFAGTAVFSGRGRRARR